MIGKYFKTVCKDEYKIDKLELFWLSKLNKMKDIFCILLLQ